MQNKSSGVELLVVGALALIAIVSLMFLGLCVKYGSKGDLAPIISIASVSIGALASLLVKLQGQSTPLFVTTLESHVEPVQLPAVVTPPPPAVPTVVSG